MDDGREVALPDDLKIDLVSSRSSRGSVGVNGGSLSAGKMSRLGNVARSARSRMSATLKNRRRTARQVRVVILA